jgi:hypothetical protein
MIVLLDPAIDSKNLGDEIISSYTQTSLSEVFPGEEITRIPTHRIWSASERKRAKAADFFVMGGSNLLAHNFPFNWQWRITPLIAER